MMVIMVAKLVAGGGETVSTHFRSFLALLSVLHRLCQLFNIILAFDRELFERQFIE